MILIANMICDCRFVADTGCPGLFCSSEDSCDTIHFFTMFFYSCSQWPFSGHPVRYVIGGPLRWGHGVGLLSSHDHVCSCQSSVLGGTGSKFSAMLPGSNSDFSGKAPNHFAKRHSRDMVHVNTSWTGKNKMTLNLLKTVEIVFHRPAVSRDLLPPKRLYSAKRSLICSSCLLHPQYRGSGKKL